MEKLAIVVFGNEEADLVALGVAQLVQVEAADNAELLVEIAFGVEVAAKTGADERERPQPGDLLGKQLVFFVGQVDLDFALILVFQKLFDAVVQFQGRSDEDEPVVREANNLFEIIIRCAGV